MKKCWTVPLGANVNVDVFKGCKWDLTGMKSKQRNDCKRWKCQARHVKCSPGLWEIFWLFICGTQTSLQAEFNTWFCLIAQKLKMVKNSKGMRMNSHHISKCNYKAFNRLCCPDRPTLWNHAQIRKCSVRFKFRQHQRARHCIICSRGEKIQQEAGEKTQNRLERSQRSPPHYSAALHVCCGWAQNELQQGGVCVCVCVDGQQSVQCLCSTHGNTDTNTGEEVVIVSY